MGSRRKSAAGSMVVLLAAAAAWLFWPRPVGDPRPAASRTTESATQAARPGLASAPARKGADPAGPKPEPLPPAGAASASASVHEGGILEGEVRDPEGHPAVGVVVTALEPDEPLPPRRKGHQWYVFDEEIAAAKAGQPSAVSDAAGRFEIRGVQLGKPSTAAVHVSDRLDGRSGSVTFSAPGERQRRDVRIPRPGSLLVKFLARAGGDVPGAQINVLGPTGWMDSFDDADQKDGAWLVEGLRPGSYEIQIFPPDSPVENRKAEVRAGERTLVEIGAPAGKTLDGFVVDTKGEPVPQVHVWWIGSGTILGEADDAGRFRFHGILDDVGTLRVDPFGFRHREDQFARVDVEGVVPGGDPVRIVLPPAPHVLARVVGLDPATPVTRSVVSRSLTYGGGSPDPVADGRIDVALPEAGVPSMLVLHTAGLAPLVVEFGSLTPGERRDLGELRFDKGRAIVGVVRDENGTAVVGATVLVAEKWLDEEHETSEEGEFRFDHVPDRPTDIRVNAKGFPVHIRTLPAGPAGAKPAIRITHGGTLSIRVLDARGAAVAGAHLSVRPDGPHPYDVDFDKTRRGGDADAEGRLEARLEARGHHVSAHSADWKQKGEIDSVVVKEGQATAIEIRVR